MKYSHKAQIQSKVFIYLFVAIVILLLLVFSYISIKKARERARELEQKRLENEIEASLQEIEYGSVECKKLNVPEVTKEICFTDITKRSETLKSPILKANKYKRMKNIIQSGEKKNIFFLMQQEPKIASIYIPGICFDHYPYFSCFEPRVNILNICLEGKGSCALIIMEYKVCETIPYEEGRTPEIGTTHSQEISFGSIHAKLTIPAGTVLQPAPEEICIEATSYLGAEGLISEVYNITPTHITSNQNVKFDLKYENFLLPPNADASHIKLKKKSSPWELLDNPIVDMDYSRVSGDTQSLSYIAVFGPEPPTANISVNGDYIPEDTEVIVAKDTDINFDGSASNDPDNDITNYEWDFGDETTETGANVIHNYPNLGSYNLTLTVTDATGYEDTAKIIVTVVNDNNQKDIPDGTIIIISNPTSNWRNILQLVPVAMWKSIDGDKTIPFLVYHKEGSITSADFKLTDLGNKYPSVTTKQIDLFTAESALTNQQDVSQKSLETDYFSYWLEYEDIVVVDYNNQNVAVMASLFAAFINAPIIFIDSAHLPDVSVIDRKTAHVVDYTGLDQASKDYIDNNANIRKGYTLSDLKNPTKNQYQTLKSRIVLTS